MVHLVAHYLSEMYTLYQNAYIYFHKSSLYPLYTVVIILFTWYVFRKAMCTRISGWHFSLTVFKIKLSFNSDLALLPNQVRTHLRVYLVSKSQSLSLAYSA